MTQNRYAFLFLLAVLASAGSAFAATGVGVPWLAGPRLYETRPGDIPLLYSDQDTGFLVRPSIMSGFLSWRLYHDGLPMGTTHSGATAALLDRLLETSTADAWRRSNAENSIRSSTETGSLLPTIYLPLDMPPILARTIGEGGQLDISGTQRISLSGITHYRPNAVEVEGQHTSMFPDLRMEQQLQVRLEGTIGEKIHVDVDHDSEREMQPENRIRLAYEGWEDEIIQSIEMGDVSLAITGPEFVSYSIPHEGLFGAKVLAQAGPVDFTMIASKEASSTESADFVGQATLFSDSLLDIHPADNYFYTVFADTAPQPVIAQIRVFVDDRDATNNDETGALPGTLINYSGPDSLGYWDELLPGPDQDFWLLDSTVIELRTPVNDNYWMAVWLVTATGDTLGECGMDSLNLHLIKTSDPLPTDPTWFNELRNRYFLGSNNIVQESFNCQIYLTVPGEEPVSTQDGVPFIELLGLDTNGDGSLSDEEGAVDWENGFLVFPEVRPFESGSLEVTNPLVYSERNPAPVDSRYFIAVSYRAASTTYSLGNLGIVPGSERVTLTVSGQEYVLTRDVDYTIIYEIGLLTLMGERAEDAQDPSSVLRVTYEYLPFMAAQQKTLFGTRAVYNLGEGTWIGATAMFENTSTPEDRPRVGEESSRTLVTDIDARYELRPGFLTDFANAVPLVRTEAESRVVLSGEVAASFPDPNTDDKAYIDDMEGTETSFSVGQTRMLWWSSSSPLPGSPLLEPVGDLKWYNRVDYWRLQDIIEGATGEQALEKVNSVLELRFDPRNGDPSSWGGMMRCVDRYGLDFSEKTRITLYVRAVGGAQDANIYLDLGERIDEDSYWLERSGDLLEMRANGELDTEDADGNGDFSTNEDTGLDGVFNADEYPAYDPSIDSNRDNRVLDDYYSPNGYEQNDRLDTEDLNRNGLLDRSNSFFRVRIPLDDPDYVVSGPNEAGWMLVEIPLTDTSLVTVPDFVTSEPTWDKICYARLWVDGFTEQDTISIYDMSIVGNKWEQRPVGAWGVAPPVEPGEQLVVYTVNNRDNSDYAADPPPGINPGLDEQDEPRLEQSLVLEAIGIMPGHEGRARQEYYSSEDYTGYSSIRFPVHGDISAAGEIFYRLGRDSLNYYEIISPLTPGWQTVGAEMGDLTDVKELKAERGLDYLRVGDIAVRGNPSLRDIQEMSVGIRNTTGTPINTVAWVDDITLHGAWSDVDLARRVSTSIEVADLMTLTGDYRTIGADFHGLGDRTGQGSTTTSLSSGLTLNVEKFTPPLWSLSLPATLAWRRQVSEPRFTTNSDLRLEGDEAWEARTQSDQWDTSVTWRRSRRSAGFLGRYFVDPWELRHTYSQGRGRSPAYRDSLQSARGQVSYDLGLSAQPLFRLPLLGGIQLRPSHLGWSVTRQNSWDTRWELSSQDTVRTRATQTRSLGTDGSVAFNFWQGQSTSFSLGVNRDLLYPWDRGLPFNAGREISRSQGFSVSQDINLWNYLMPRVSFDAAYGSVRLAPHTSSGEDSLGMPDVSLTTTRRLNVRIGLAQLLRSIGRLRDERLDEQTDPGSPRWLLMKLDRLADMINDPTVVISRSIGSEYDELGFYPGLDYRFGFVTELEGIPAYDRTRSDNLQVSGGIRPVSSMTIRTEYNRSDSRHFYSGYWNRQISRTWPSINVSWTGLERLAPLSRLLRSGTVSTGYRIEENESGRFEDGEYIRTSTTTTNRWAPLFSVTAQLENKVQVSLTDNYSVTETRNFTGTMALTRSSSSGVQMNIQYAFSAPGGLAIPLPLLDRIRVSFQSELTTALMISRTRTVTEIIAAGFEDQVQSDREEWRIEPSANYDFGTVTAGLTGIYGWKTDRVNSLYDQKDVGLEVWVSISF